VLDVLFDFAGTEFALGRGEHTQNLQSCFVSEPLEQGSKLFDRLAAPADPRHTAARLRLSFLGDQKARCHAVNLRLELIVVNIDKRRFNRFAGKGT